MKVKIQFSYLISARKPVFFTVLTSLNGADLFFSEQTDEPTTYQHSDHNQTGKGLRTIPFTITFFMFSLLLSAQRVEGVATSRYSIYSDQTVMQITKATARWIYEEVSFAFTRSKGSSVNYQENICANFLRMIYEQTQTVSALYSRSNLARFFLFG